MSNIVDDLQQDVEQLKASTQEISDNIQSTEQAKKELKESIQSTQNKLFLETAKTAQEASTQSHLAASTSIKLAEQLNARNAELEALSNNWRQAVRNTLRDQQAAKKYFGIMLGATLATSIITLGSLGYFLYLSNQQNAQHRGDILDIIQTESKLLSNKLIVKTDELASLTEAMSSDIKRLSNLNQTPITETPKVNPLKTNNQPPENSGVFMTMEQLNTQYTELKTLITKIIAQQQVKNTLKENPVYLKKLNDLNWLIKKQEKTIKSIQTTLATKISPPSLNNKQIQKTLAGLRSELTHLNQQQEVIQTQLKVLQTSLTKQLKQSANPPPYSYKSTTDYTLN